MAFAPIGHVVNKVAEKSVELLPVVGPGLKYIKTAKKVTKFTNPVWATSAAAGIVTGNPAFIAVSIEAGQELLEDFYG